jgi:TIR domain
LQETAFVDVGLEGAIGLEACEHVSFSTLDHRTLRRSRSLPLAFLRGVGLPDTFIQYLPSLLDEAIQHYTCFLSHSTKNGDFAGRLHADLQNNGVRCWFAPHDMPIGGKIWDEIDLAIRLRDRVLLILSEHSIASDWVEDEVTRAFEEERKRGQTVLFPIRLDDAVMDTDEAWAAKLRARHIGDFTRWKEHDEYQKSFARVLRDLTVKKE